jgi:hypothetical protein
MTTYLAYFLNEEQLIIDAAIPDTGIEYVQQLTAEDWKVIESKWDDYSIDWKSAMTYFAGFIEITQSSSVLFKALFDKDEELVLQALFSIYESMSFLDSPFELKAEIKAKLMEEIQKRQSQFDVYPELEELEEMIKA